MDKIFINKMYQAFADAAPDFIAAELPAVATIDKYRGQPTNPQKFEYFKLPAIFYQLKIKWTKVGKLYNGLMSCDFHVMQDATWEVSNIATNKDEGLKQVDFLQLVRSVIDNLESPTTGKMHRGEELSVETEVVVYDLLNYTCSYYEQAMITKQKFVETVGEGLNITSKILEDRIS